MNTHSSLRTHSHHHHLALSLIETTVCEGLDCADINDKRSKDWFGDVELIDLVDDADRDQFGDRSGS